MNKKIQFRIEAKNDDLDVRGNAIASGDDAEDKRVEDEIIERINSGDVWAWASVRVVALIPGIDLEGDDYLGACSYANEEGFKTGGYFEDMCKRAASDLMDKINAVKSLT